MLSVMLMLCALLLAAGSVSAQQMEPTTYTFVAEWQIPRAQWANFVADFEKNTRPVLEKMAANGTLVAWGAFETIVHTEEGMTHGTWWSSNTVAGIESTRAELLKASTASSSLGSATKHRDYYLRSLIGNGKAAAGTNGYLSVSSYLVKPGQGQEWRQMWEKNNKAIYDDLVAKGLVLGYSIDVEDIHTDNPGWRHVVSMSPNADAEDKIGAAFDAANAKRSAQEQQAMTAAMANVLEPGTHRDGYAKIIRYWHK